MPSSKTKADAEVEQKDEDVFCKKCLKLCASIFSDGEEVQHESLLVIFYNDGGEQSAAVVLCEQCTETFHKYMYNQLSEEQQTEIVESFLAEEEKDAKGHEG